MEIISLQKKENIQLKTENLELEAIIDSKKKKRVEFQNHISFEQKKTSLEISKIKERLSEEESSIIYKLKNDYRNSEKEMIEMRQQIQSLQENLQKSLEEKLLLQSEKEKEKILSNHSYKILMKEKLEEANHSLQMMKKKELEGTKKLSILQNLQLIVELENQSDKIEHHLSENEKLRTEVEELHREVNTHKCVEVNFSKKSVKNQKLILTLTHQLNESSNNLKRLIEQQ